MQTLLPIGYFARATQLSVKTLRLYHESGLLEPAEVDPQTGYRRYTTEQIPTAQIIRRFRDLDMPLNAIKAVLAAPDLQARGELIAAHLSRLEGDLARTQSAVASLRDLLRPPGTSRRIEHRGVKPTLTAAITQVVEVKDALAWHQGALGELYATLASQCLAAAGPSGGVFANALFSSGRGEGTIFVPCEATVRPMGRVMPMEVPAVELATILHVGGYTDIDLAYGALATYVAQHALAINGPIREYYLIGPHDTTDEAAWRTEIGWPIFQTGAGARPEGNPAKGY
jgi:DNA-binding transcriptional MerR regulator/effector-binding domain-containing protein